MVNKFKIYKFCVIAIILIITSFVITKLICYEKWPEIPANKTYSEIAKKSVEEYKARNCDHTVFLSENGYDAFGDYLNWSTYRNFSSLKTDLEGMVMVEYDG